MFEKIYLWTDMDEPGRKAAAEIAGRLGRERCYRVELPAPHKDANEAQCVGNFDFAGFQDAVDAARTLDPVELKNLSEFSAEGWEALYPTSQATVGTEPPINLPWRCRFGEVTVWTGWSGHGKTLALNNFVVHDASQGERCCIASLEMPAAKLVAAMVRITLGQKPPKERRDRYDAALGWLREKVWIVNKTGVLHWTKVIPIMEYAARRYGCTRFVVDSLMRLGVAEDDYNGQKEAVGAMVEFAAKHGHVHIVCHSRKQEDESKAPGKFDVRGSVAITDLIDNGMTVWRNKGKEHKIEEFLNGKDDAKARHNIERERDSQISLWKQRDEGDEPWRNLWLDRSSGQFLNSHDATPRVYIPEPSLQQAELIDEPDYP